MHKTGNVNADGGLVLTIFILTFLKFLFGKVIKIIVKFNLKKKNYKRDTTNYIPTPWFKVE